MPTHTTRDIIQDARDQLVGKVPLPIDQCHEITRALVYKFLSSADTDTIALAGKPTYFVDAYNESHWDRLMAPEQTANEIQRLYTAGLTMLGSREDIPSAFQTIYQDAFIPYNDPIVLRDFLGIINKFNTDDTESIGDAYETMLQYLGAQASAGQFRTPRHIIDFIVGIVNPEQHETILDPACGTAGFLASAYSHIAGANVGNFSFSDQAVLARNLVGYDISPDMVKLATINLYLNHRQSPDVSVYDTLNERRTLERPLRRHPGQPAPLCRRKGASARTSGTASAAAAPRLSSSITLSTHLNDRGRAGVIVPEGVIFQQQRGHTELRRLLVENCLVAVISLPGGVFQPYSGVKTSILIMDKALGRKTDHIAFFKVENDGYDLGAQRREIAANDLPAVQAEIAEYLRRLRGGKSVDDFEPTLGLVVAKERIADGGDYNLSGERYRNTGMRLSEFPIVSLGEVVEILDKQRKPITKHDRKAGPYPYYGATGVLDYVAGYIFDEPLVLLGEDGAKWEAGMRSAYHVDGKVWVNNHAHVLRSKRDRLLDKFLIEIINQADLTPYITGVTVPKLNQAKLKSIQIPLPPLEVQREIVAEIEEYQRVIDGARAVVDNWRPRIAVDPEWPLTYIPDAVADQPYSCKAGPFGSTLKKESYVPSGYKIYGQEQVIRNDVSFGDYYIGEEKFRELASCKVEAGDVLVSLVGTYGKTLIIPNDHEPGIINPRLLKITLDANKMIPEFFVAIFAQETVMSQVRAKSHGGTMNILSMKILKDLRIPLPPLETQQAIVAEIEAERAAVDHARDLAARMQARIDAAIGRVWGG